MMPSHPSNPQAGRSREPGARSPKRGKRSKFSFFLASALRELVPGAVCRLRLPGIVRSGLARYGRAAIDERVDYYNKLSVPAPLMAGRRLDEQKLGGKSRVYYFDTREILRFFPQHLRWCHVPGDVTYIPSEPTIVKSRPIAGDNANNVLLNLNKVRHFVFVDDPTPFSRKKDIAVFRGKIPTKAKRLACFERHFGNPLCDLGDTSSEPFDHPEWRKGRLTIPQQLACKFILAIEGNDVASNLKWVMSSNSLAMMPRPEFETWFMEGRLVPNVHYVELAPDFSDLDEKIRYYSAHVDEAEAILAHAHAWVEQFLDPRRERLIALLVAQKYFAMTNPSRR